MLFANWPGSRRSLSEAPRRTASAASTSFTLGIVPPENASSESSVSPAMARRSASSQPVRGSFGKKQFPGNLQQNRSLLVTDESGSGSLFHPIFEIDHRHRDRLEVERRVDQRDVRVTPDSAASEVIVDPPDTDHSGSVQLGCAQRSHAGGADHGFSRLEHGQDFLGRHRHVLPEFSVEDDEDVVIRDGSEVAALDRRRVRAGCKAVHLCLGDRWPGEHNRLHRSLAPALEDEISTCVHLISRKARSPILALLPCAK